MPTVQSNTPRLDLDALLDALADRIAARLAAPAAQRDSEWLTPQQTADLLGLKVNTLEIWRCKGKGPQHHKVGRNTVRYKRAEVMAWMDATARSSTSAPVRRRK